MDEGNIAIEVRDAVKRFGAVTALAGASLTIRDNEFFTLLGCQSAFNIGPPIGVQN